VTGLSAQVPGRCRRSSGALFIGPGKDRTPIERSVAPMAYGTVVLRIWQHGPRADDLLAAIAEALGLTETLSTNDGPHQVMLAVIDIEQARRQSKGSSKQLAMRGA
jgi:hypothetical protein